VAKELFSKRIRGNEKAIPASLRWEVFGIVSKYGGREETEALFDIWIRSSNEDERYLALECLGRAPDAELVRWVLSHAFTDSIQNQDVSRFHHQCSPKSDTPNKQCLAVSVTLAHEFLSPRCT
jgi:hypothetical protein